MVLGSSFLSLVVSVILSLALSLYMNEDPYSHGCLLVDKRTRVVFAQILDEVIQGTQGHILYLTCSFGQLAKPLSSA